MNSCCPDDSAQRPAPRLRLPNRDLPLAGLSPEQLLPQDDIARSVWSFVRTLDLSPLYNAIKAVQGHPGRNATDPRLLFALWLLATLDGVRSARELNRFCGLHLSYLWLLGGVSVNYHTLADFRVDHGDLLDQLLTDSVAVMLREGLISLEETAQDGLRIRAAAGAASFRRRESLEECLQEAQQHLERLKQQEDAETTPGQRAARERAASERQKRLEQALEALGELQEQRQRRNRRDEEEKDSKRPPRASTTDPECRKMKMPDGGYRPAYNAQFNTTTKGGVIVGVEVTNQGNDFGQVEPMVEQAEERYGEAPQRHMVDGGFASKEDIEATYQNYPQTEIYAPVKQVKKEEAKADKEAAKAAAEGTGAAPASQAVDAAGKEAVAAGPEATPAAQEAAAADAAKQVTGAEGKEAAPAEKEASPTEKDKAGKKPAKRRKDKPGVAAWRARMETPEAKEMYKKRAATAELSNAQVRNHGLYQVLVRGLAKVKAVVLWHALAHNLTRWMALRAAAA